MAAPKLSLLSFSICLLLLCHGSQAQEGYGERRSESRRSRCRIDRLSAFEPMRRVESEAGSTEFFEENNEQFECAGVAAMRQTIEPRGLLLPSFSNAPRLVYVLQGRGLTSAVVPGCPETFQSSPQSYSEGRHDERHGQMYREQHQRVHRFRQGDIVAFPAGIPHWCYNDGDTPVVTITVFDTSSSANQLDRTHRHFLLAGSRRGQQHSYESERPSEREREQSSGDNVLRGFDVELLADAIGISRETARKLQSRDDRRGHIVRLERELHVLRPPRMEEREEREESEESEEREYDGRRPANGLDEALCTMRIRENIDNPSRADVYNPRGGRITTLNSQKLPILRHIQMTAERGVLHRNAITGPKWMINAHSVVYVTRGRARCQVVDDRGRTVFDGELRRGQLVIVPQNFAALKKAGSEGFHWVAFMTSGSAMTSPIVGKTSVLRGMPEDVLANAYQISREEARRLKYNRGQETAVFAPRYRKREYD